MLKPVSLNKVKARGKWYVYVRGTKIKVLNGATGTREDIDAWAAENMPMIEAKVAAHDRRFENESAGWRLDAAALLHRTTMRRALSKNADYHLSRDLIEEMLIKSGDRCTISGLPFVYLPKSAQDLWHRRPYMPSLDRKDNSRGYTVANTRVVAVCVNIAINEWGEEVFRNMVRSCSENDKSVLQK